MQRREKKLPKKLYKYAGFNGYSLKTLTEAENFYCNPKIFNDPLDCSPTINWDIEIPDMEELLRILLKKYLGENEVDARMMTNRLHAQDYEGENNYSYETFYKAIIVSDISYFLPQDVEKVGVLALSANWNSPLMWSHYADQHRGICIEYDTTDLEHPNIGPVNYGGPRSINASDILAWKRDGSRSAKERIHKVWFFSKASQWRYENEWRDINSTSGSYFTRFRMTGILFGLRCQPPVITSIVRLLHDKQVTFKSIDVSNNSFKLTRKAVDTEDILENGVREYFPFFFRRVDPDEPNLMGDNPPL